MLVYQRVSSKPFPNAPWSWKIYQHLPEQNDPVLVGKYTSTMVRIWVHLHPPSLNPWIILGQDAREDSWNVPTVVDQKCGIYGDFALRFFLGMEMGRCSMNYQVSWVFSAANIRFKNHQFPLGFFMLNPPILMGFSKP